MEGLAQTMAQPIQQAAPEQGGMPTVEQVIQMLMEGADPEELVKMGVPPELVMQAVEMLQQQMTAQQQAIPVEQQGGLAAQSMGM